MENWTNLTPTMKRKLFQGEKKRNSSSHPDLTKAGAGRGSEICRPSCSGVKTKGFLSLLRSRWMPKKSPEASSNAQNLSSPYPSSLPSTAGVRAMADIHIDGLEEAALAEIIDLPQNTATVDDSIEAGSDATGFYLLTVVLKDGRNLIAKDSSGTSDPYVKFKVGSRQVYKSQIVFKCLNPRWNETFTTALDSLSKPVIAQVFDYDRLSDDPMGSANIDLTNLVPEMTTPLQLNLTGPKRNKKSTEDFGYILVDCLLQSKSAAERDEYFKRTKDSGSSQSGASPKKVVKTQRWTSIVTIVLVEGHDLLPMDDNGLSDPYCRFKLGNEKYKSKTKPKTLDPRWLEQFDLYVFDDTSMTLELTVWDYDAGNKDEFMGRADIDLVSFERDHTYAVDQQLEDGAGIIKLLVTITAVPHTEGQPPDLTLTPVERKNISKKYGLLNSFKNMRDVGWLQVKVLRAQSLLSADIGGKSDPFCVLELVNDRVQTFTEYKNLDPVWNKVFTFQVKDIHSILEVIVFDEDPNKKYDFLGKVAIPLLKIRPGERKWYTLKDNKLMNRTRGAILLEIDFIYNHVKAAIRTFNPREEKYMQPDPKFKPHVLKRNIDRVSRVIEAAVQTGKFIKSCFMWESKARSIIAFIVFVVAVWNIEVYMLPVTLFLIFLKNLFISQITGNLMKDRDEDNYFNEDDDDDDEESKDSKDEKKSFRERLQMVQDVCLQVQEGMDMVASLGERVKNASNWAVPWLSTVAMIVLLLASVLLYYVPLRIIILLWGINKFTKKLRNPNFIDNNELLDYLSRAPSDKEVVMFRELRPDDNILSPKKKRN